MFPFITYSRLIDDRRLGASKTSRAFRLPGQIGFKLDLTFVGTGESSITIASSRDLAGSDTASDYQLVAYTEASNARNKARQLINDRPMKRDAAAYMIDNGFMRVALNSSSPKRSGTATALSSSSTTTNTSSSPTVIFTVWDGDWAVLEEYTTGNVLVEQYLQGYHGLVKTFQNVAYYYQDELGSTSHIADASGALLEYYKYNLYGKPQ